MLYQIQIHFENRGQFNFAYEPDAGETIDDFLLQYDITGESNRWQLTGDENTWGLIAMDKVAAIIAVPYPESEAKPRDGGALSKIENITRMPEADYAIDKI